MEYIWFKTRLKQMKKKKILPYSRQYITKDDIFSVNKVLKSDFLTKGKKL